MAAPPCTIAAFAGEPLVVVSAPRSRTAADILLTLAHSMEGVGHPKATGLGDTLVVLSPEHAGTIAADGWSKHRIRTFLWERLRKPVKALLPGRDGGEGLADDALARYPSPETNETPIPKFRSPDNLKIIVVGGTAGRFSAVMPGWSFPNAPSSLVIKKITLPKS